MLSPRDAAVLEFLRRQATEAAIASLPTIPLRVLFQITPTAPSPISIQAWKGQA